MDQACNDDHSQKFFVSRKNCQRLLKNYYNGDHSASYAKIDNHTPTWILIQIVLNLSVICTLGILAPIVKCVTIVPTKQVEGYALDDDDVDDDDDDDDDWDDEYFKRPEAKAVGRWEGYKFPFYKDFELLLHFFYIPRVKFINHTCKQLRAPPASKAACTHTYKLSFSPSFLHSHHLSLAHSLSVLFFLYIVLYFINIVGNPFATNGWSWQYRTGYLQPALPDHLDEAIIFEFLLWLYLFGRAIEELEQATLLNNAEGGVLTKFYYYLNDGWNLLDFTTVVLMLTCFAMRLILWVDVWPNTFYNGEPTGGMSVFVDVREGFVPVAPETRVVLTQFIQIFFSVSALLVFLRSCEARLDRPRPWCPLRHDQLDDHR